MLASYYLINRLSAGKSRLAVCIDVFATLNITTAEVAGLPQVRHIRPVTLPPYIKANKLVAIIEHKAKAAIEKHGKKR